MAVNIQLRRDTAANWTSENPILAEGEIGFETDTSEIKIGDGATAWNSLTYYSALIGGGVTDHGALTGLSDDDHPQYMLESLLDAKGDLISASADNTPVVVTAGADYSSPQYLAAGTGGFQASARQHAIVLASDQARGTSTNTLSNVTGMTFSIPAGLTVLGFEYEGFYESTLTTNGILLSVNAGGGTVRFNRTTGTTGTTNASVYVTSLDGGSAETSVDTANVGRYFRLYGKLISPSGTLALRFANEVSSGTANVTILAGATLRVWMI